MIFICGNLIFADRWKKKSGKIAKIRSRKNFVPHGSRKTAKITFFYFSLVTRPRSARHSFAPFQKPLWNQCDHTELYPICPVFVLAQELSELSWGMTSTIMHIEEGVIICRGWRQIWYDSLCLKKKKGELRSIGEGLGWPFFLYNLAQSVF